MSHIDVKMKGTGADTIPAKITVVHNLIMLHAPYICAQWPLDATGIELTHQGDGIIKLGFHHTTCSAPTYQSFYFDAQDHDVIDLFFKTYHFPMPKPYWDDAIKDRTTESTDDLT